MVGYVQATVEAEDGLLVAELAWVLARPAQGRGLAGEAATAIATWLRERGVARLVAHVHPDHAASMAVARRAGLLRARRPPHRGAQAHHRLQIHLGAGAARE